MYAPHNPFASTRGHTAPTAYRHVAVESRIASADPHALVAMLFDDLLEALAHAKGAMQNGRIEAKGHAIGRAVRIIDEGLKAGLNLHEGGALASDLHELYTYVTLRLVRANLENDVAALDACQRLVEPLASAWAAIGPSSAPRV